ncbi:angiopoietin-related protein 7-like [Drosophila nasuta]|uniref:angiopoietin-related protein 7-like n=1 Tax=Drosophila nasuta TaxID=42062 RepID=UPI00295E7FD7|nr:angiopoietin-related protein 7-like [Drosophila nasuta]
MCKIKINAIVFLIILQIFLVASAAFKETIKSDGQMAEKCCSQTYEAVKPLLDYFRLVKNDLEEREIKENNLIELNSDLMEKYREIVEIHELFMNEAALLNEYKIKVGKGENDLQSSQIKVDKLESEINSQKTVIAKLEAELANKSSDLEICEIKLKTLDSVLIEKDENKTSLFSSRIELQLKEMETKLKTKDTENLWCRFEINLLNNASENMREEQRKMSSQIEEWHSKTIVSDYQNILCRSELDKLSPTTCIPFGDYPGVHQLNVSGIDFFDVLCDSQLAGPGWIVIQQRVGRNEDFNRDWDTYREGFGALDSDFFIGLEKIYRITSLQRFELYIHLVAVNGSVYNARYDDFKISDEDNGYTLSLGKWNGTSEDAMRIGENMKFSTFDRDNDFSGDNCAVEFKSGWWYNSCHHCNLNQKNLLHPSIDLKEAKMLIHPKEAMNL